MAGSNFVDYVKIFARSGHGGAGSCHFRREKFVAFGGPTRIVTDARRLVAAIDYIVAAQQITHR